MVAAYQVVLRPAALRVLRKLQGNDRKKIHAAIELLSQDPLPPSVRKLRGRDAMRVRVGDYRVIYTVDTGVLLVAIVAVGHRRDMYRH